MSKDPSLFPGDENVEVPKRRSKARQKFSPLSSPKSIPDPGTPDRDTWIAETCDSFVAPGDANRAYYKIFLEELWPAGHGIPGPHVKQEQIRAAIDRYRESIGKKPYRDPFRRFRELQGEEGLKGVAKVGQTYQLVSLDVADKRIPRTGLSDKDWAEVLRRYDHKCANCRRGEPKVRLQQDHKVPRVRADKVAVLSEGVDSLENWQPLCDECNIAKSINCRGCELDCFKCPWAFPEKYPGLKLAPENLERIIERAKHLSIDPNELINRIVSNYLES